MPISLALCVRALVSDLPSLPLPPPQIAALWWFAEPALKACDQPVDIAVLAARYTRRSIPGLIGYAGFEALRRFLQVQGIVYPMLWVSALTNLLHPLWNWLFIFKLGWGFDGAPWATVVSQTLMCVLMLAYCKWAKPHDEATWAGFSKQAFSGLGEYLKLGVPGGASSPLLPPVCVCVFMWNRVCVHVCV